MESVAACPQDALAMIRRTLALVEQAEGAIERLPEQPGAARNLFDALMENRAILRDALRITGDIVEPAYRAGWDDRGHAEERRRSRRLQAV